MADQANPTNPESNPDPERSSGQPPGEATEQPLSLEQLTAAFARMLGRDEGALEVDQPSPEAPDIVMPEEDDAAAEPADYDSDRPPPRDPVPISPRAIFEALLFVGHPRNLPLTSDEAASLMRGVSAGEVDLLVEALNRDYGRWRCPYRIVREQGGWRLELRDEYKALRDRFHGKVREARLSQAAVDVLAIVAYNQPVTRDEVTGLRGTPSGPVLAQLVRRLLLRLERPEAKPRTPRYYTTERFLRLFGLGSLEDLPQSQDLDQR